jgi:chemotaxis protein CheX
MNIKNFLEFSKPFIDATKMVFEKMMETQIESAKPELKTDSKMYGDISAVIGMSGNKTINDQKSRFRGLLVLSFSEDVYVKIANKMLQEAHTQFNDEIQDVGAEIINIIMGNAKKTLNTVGLFPEMATPSTIRGTGHTITSLDRSYTIIIPFKSSLGEFKMEICYVDI